MNGVREFKRHKVLRVVGIVFACLSLVLLGVAAVTGSIRWAKVQAATEQADGVVVEMARRGKGRSPVVEITPPGGAPVRFRSTVSSQPPRYHVGEHVAVRYDPRAPEDAFIDTFWEKWFFPLLFGMIGGFYLIVSGALVFFAARMRGREEELRAGGDRVPGTVVEVDRARAGKRRAYKLVVETKEAGRRYSSNPVMLDDPKEMIGRAVFVIVDRQNPARYLVDLAE